MSESRSHQITPMPLHPVFLSALIVLVANDHFLKQTFGNWWTGKISDAAWLVLCPLFIVGVYEHVAKRSARTSQYVTAILGVAFALLAINTVPVAGDLYQTGLAAAQWPFKALSALFSGDQIPTVGRVALTRDATDLITLPFALVALAIGKTRPIQDDPKSESRTTGLRAELLSRRNPANA